MKSIITAVALFSIFGAGAALASDPSCEAHMKAEAAIGVARTQGVAVITDVECDGGRWDIEGRNAQNLQLEVLIEANGGRVISVRRDH